MEGPTSPITCVSSSGYVKCSFENKCVFRGIWLDVKNRINEVVDKTTFQDLLEKAKILQKLQGVAHNSQFFLSVNSDFPSKEKAS